jgi:hypothetical protein
VANGSGAVGNANVTTASVSCTSQYTVGGTLTGLNGTVVLQDNGGNNLTLTANGSFAFTTALVSGAAYAVTVLTQPTRQTCVVSSGSGKVASANVTSVSVNCTYTSSNATLSGVYNGLIYAAGTGSSGSASFASLSSTTTLSGGNYTETIAKSNINGNIGTGSSSESGTYSVTTEGALTDTRTGATVGLSGGVLGADGDAYLAAAVTANGPAVFEVFVKAGSGVTQAALAGNYTITRLSIGTSSAEADLEKLTVDSSGNYQESATQNISGSITTGSDSSTVSVSTSGALTFDGGNSIGGISADGDLLVFQDFQVGHTPAVSFGVKKGTSVTTATLSGSYTIVGYNSGLNGGAGTVVDLTTIIMDGRGNFSGSVVQNNSGVIASTATSGTYTVQADGTLTMVDAQGHTSNGAVSADGNALVLANVASGATPKVFIGLRQ